MNSINMGNFLGGLARGAGNGLDMYSQYMTLQQQKSDFEAQQAATAQIKALPLIGSYTSDGSQVATPPADPSAPPPQSLQPNNADNTMPSSAAYAIPGIADAMTPPADPNAPAPQAAALPPGQAPYGIAAPPDPSMPNLPPVQRAPQGAAPVTGAPPGQRLYTPEMHAQAVENIYNNSGNMAQMKIGQSMQQNRLNNQLLKMQVKNGEMDLVARQTGQNVMRAYAAYQSNPQGGLDMLNSIGNDGVDNGSRMTQTPADGPGNEGKIVVTHWGPNGKFMGQDPAQTPDHLFMNAATLGDPEKHMAMLKEWSAAAAEAQKGEYYQAESARLHAILAAGGPQAEVDKTKADIRNLDANTDANVAYKKAETMNQQLKAETDQQKKAYLATYNSVDPNVTQQQKNQARQAFEALDGKFANVAIHGTPNGMIFREDPSNAKYPTTVWNEGLQQFLPQGVDGNGIAKDPLFKNGSITPAWFANGTYGYVVKGQEINPKTGQPQGADTWLEAKRLYEGKAVGTPTALPKATSGLAPRPVAKATPPNPTGALDPNWRRNATYANTVGGPDLTPALRAVQGPANWRNPGGAQPLPAAAAQSTALPASQAPAPIYVPPPDSPARSGSVSQDQQNRLDYYTLPQHTGMVERGNLDPWHRPILKNSDGTYSTTLSFSIGTDKGETIIPQVINGVKLTKAEAIAEYKKTGKNFGSFRDIASANDYAQRLHDSQDAFIKRGQ